jgi:hypothetical protein
VKNHISLNIRAWTSKPDKNVENIILHCNWDGYAAQKAYEYARAVLKAPWPRGERVILKSPHYCYLYARHVIQGRWIKAEKVIATDCSASYRYARYVIKGRFEQGENSRSTGSFFRGYYNEQYIYYYSKYILKGRWKKMEDKMINKKDDDKHFSNVEQIVNYAVNVMKHRWKRAEPQIVKSRYIEKYAKVLTQEELEDFQKRILLESLVEPEHRWSTNYAREYIKKIGLK